MMKFIQKENLITPAYLSRLCDLTFGMNGFPWYFLSEDISYDSSSDFKFGDNNLMDIPQAQKSTGFVHVLLDQEGVESPYLPLFLPLMDSVSDVFPHPVQFTRVRMALTLPMGKDPMQHNAPHTDSEKDHYAALFYLHDCSGDTVFFKEYDDPNSGSLEDRWWRARTQEYNIAKRVTPKANRLFAFDGHNFHASSNPSVEDKFRIAINFNFECEHDIFAQYP